MTLEIVEAQPRPTRNISQLGFFLVERQWVIMKFFVVSFHWIVDSVFIEY